MILFDVVMDGTCACLAQAASSASEKPAGSPSAGEEKCPAQTEVPTRTGNSQGPPERPDPVLTSSTSSSSSSSASTTQLQFGQGETLQEQPQQETNSSLSPKKKLLISSNEKEKLLSWDLDPSEDPSKALAFRKGPCRPPALLTDGKPEAASTRAPAPAPEPTPAQPQGSLPPQPQSTLQMLASAFRRSISGGSNKEASSGANVVRRANRAAKPRPLSEGSFNFVGSMFGPASQSQQESSSSRFSTATGNGHREQRRGSELAMLLQQVALSSQTPAAAASASGSGSKDDMAFPSRRKLNFFSSLRVRKRDEVEKGKVERGQEESKDKDIWTILSKFRSKGDQMSSVELLS